MQIKEYMTAEHRQCDEQFSAFEEALNAGDFAAAAEKFAVFKNEMERHFLEEERVMFVEFEERTGMCGGPTRVMTSEHNMMREAMKEIETALVAKNKTRLLGLAESLMLITQQHNMKEEQMLYNMVQMHLSDQNDAMIARMREVKVGGGA